MGYATTGGQVGGAYEVMMTFDPVTRPTSESEFPIRAGVILQTPLIIWVN